MWKLSWSIIILILTWSWWLSYFCLCGDIICENMTLAMSRWHNPSSKAIAEESWPEQCCRLSQLLLENWCMRKYHITHHFHIIKLVTINQYSVTLYSLTPKHVKCSRYKWYVKLFIHAHGSETKSFTFLAY